MDRNSLSPPLVFKWVTIEWDLCLGGGAGWIQKLAVPDAANSPPLRLRNGGILPEGTNTNNYIAWPALIAYRLGEQINKSVWWYVRIHCVFMLLH